MLIHPQINPIALQIGPLAVHWYGLTYLAANGICFSRRMPKNMNRPNAAR